LPLKNPCFCFSSIKSIADRSHNYIKIIGHCGRLIVPPKYRVPVLAALPLQGLMCGYAYILPESHYCLNAYCGYNLPF
jgi:hypothetical protein